MAAARAAVHPSGGAARCGPLAGGTAEGSLAPRSASGNLLLPRTVDEIRVPCSVRKDPRCDGGTFLLQSSVLASRYSRQTTLNLVPEFQPSAPTSSTLANSSCSYSASQPSPLHTHSVKIKSRQARHRYALAKSFKLLRKYQSRQKFLPFPGFSFKRPLYRRLSSTFPERIIIFGKLASIQSNFSAVRWAQQASFALSSMSSGNKTDRKLNKPTVFPLIIF